MDFRAPLSKAPLNCPVVHQTQLPVAGHSDTFPAPYYKPLQFAYNHLNPPYTSSAWVSCKPYPIPSVILHLSTLPTFNLSSMRYTYQLRRSALSQFNLQLAVIYTGYAVQSSQSGYRTRFSPVKAGYPNHLD